MSKKLVKAIMKGTAGICHMATRDGKSPRVRPMTVKLVTGGLLWTSTFTKSPKMKQIKKNGRVEFSFYDEKTGAMRIAGTIKVVKDKKKKAKFFKGTPALKHFFKSAKDPKFTMLELKPKAVLVMASNSMKYTKVKL